MCGRGMGAGRQQCRPMRDTRCRRVAATLLRWKHWRDAQWHPTRNEVDRFGCKLMAGLRAFQSMVKSLH